MNCPSRTDECTLLHPEWNQSPPFLPPDLTTRQDLNGRVNSRHHRDDGDSTAPDTSSTLDETMEPNAKAPPPSRIRGIADAELLLCYRDEVRAADPALSTLRRNSASPIENIYYLLSWCRNWVWPGITLILILVAFYLVDRGISHGESASVIQERVKRASPCATGDKSGGVDYNTPLHVGAVGIILFVSFTACSFPMLVVRFPRLHIPASFLFVVRHFGTGVLIATAFVHLLPTAFQSLGNPCLSDFWTSDYPAMPGAIALAAVFLVAVVEMVFSPGRPTCGNAADVQEAVSSPVMQASRENDSTYTMELTQTCNNDNTNKSEADGSRPRTLHRGASRRDHDPLCGRSTSIGRGLAHMSAHAVNYGEVECTTPGRRTQQGCSKEGESGDSQNSEEFTMLPLTPEQKRKKAVMQCLLLEMGILFHSVFIGMALSVSVGNEFVILLIAITFHQLFEGLALGSRIATLSWEPNALQPWLMSLAYGCTTPIGQAIGLATHTLYSPDSEVGLIMVGIMNAISSGLLVYASLVELLSEDFLSDESWRLLRGRRRVFACILVFLGAVGMSLIGAWA